MPAITEEILGRDRLTVAESLESYAALLRKVNLNAEAAEMEADAKAIRSQHARQNADSVASAKELRHDHSRSP